MSKQLKELVKLFKPNIIQAVESGDAQKIDKELLVAFRALESKLREDCIKSAYEHVEDIKKTLRY